MSTEIFSLMQGLTRHYGGFSQRALLDLTSEHLRKPAQTYLAYLIAEGIALPFRRDAIIHYAVAAGDCPPPPSGKPRTRAAHRALWTAMRGLKQFTLPELISAAATEALVPSRKLASDFIETLLALGYLRAASGSYAFIRQNVGPVPPLPVPGTCAAYDVHLRRVVNVTDQRKSALNVIRRAA